MTAVKDYFREEFCSDIAIKNGIGTRYAYIFIDDFKITQPYQEKIKKFIQGYISKFHNQKDNIVFYGDKGTGKTFASVVILKELFRRKIIEDFAYTRLHSFISECKVFYDDRKFDAMEYYLNKQLLVIDEVGSFTLSPHDYQLFFDLIDTRYSNRLKTIFITNYNTSSELLNFVHTAIADRICESIDYINFGKISLRKNIAYK